MRIRQYMAQCAVEFAADNKNGYTNDWPDNWWWDDNDDVDCGSFMSYVLHMGLLKAGIDTGHEYFEPMGSAGLYNEAFLLKYCDKYDYDDVYNEVGDILVSSGHTEMYTAPGQLTGARNDYDGVPGDYGTGREIATSAFFNNGWKWIYRLKEKYNIEIDEEEDDMIPDIKKGDSGNTVLSFQYLMRYKLGFDKQPCDGIFNDRMEYNVKYFQNEHDLHVDGIIGPITRTSMIVDTGYEEP